MPRLSFFVATLPFFVATLLATFITIQNAHALDLNPLSAIKSAVEAAVEDRSSDDIAKDLELKAKITSKIVDELGSDVFSLSTDVYEQDVMLTGAVENSALKAKAGSLAKSVQGVKKLYNEVIVILKESGLPPGFGDIGVLPGEYGSNYSWNSGVVIVPAYDSSSESEGVTIDVNMSLILGGISITSWGVD